MYNTYRVPVKIWQLYPGEKEEVWKIGNVNKIRWRQKIQDRVLFLKLELNRPDRSLKTMFQRFCQAGLTLALKKVPYLESFDTGMSSQRVYFGG